jgi:hypothetical protein
VSEKAKKDIQNEKANFKLAWFESYGAQKRVASPQISLHVIELSKSPQEA